MSEEILTQARMAEPFQAREEALATAADRLLFSVLNPAKATEEIVLDAMQAAGYTRPMYEGAHHNAYVDTYAELLERAARRLRANKVGP